MPPQNIFSNDMVTLPPSDNLANWDSISSTLDGSIDIAKLSPIAGGGLNDAGTSLPIRNPEPTGRETCMTVSSSSSVTCMSSGPSRNVVTDANSPTKDGTIELKDLATVAVEE